MNGPKAAKLSNYFDRYVQWLESALSMSKSQTMIEKLQKLIKKAKSDHDKAFKASLVQIFSLGLGCWNENIKKYFLGKI